MSKVLYIDDDKEQIDLYSFAFKTYAPDLGPDPKSCTLTLYN